MLAMIKWSMEQFSTCFDTSMWHNVYSTIALQRLPIGRTFIIRGNKGKAGKGTDAGGNSISRHFTRLMMMVERAACCSGVGGGDDDDETMNYLEEYYSQNSPACSQANISKGGHALSLSLSLNRLASRKTCLYKRGYLQAIRDHLFLLWCRFRPGRPSFRPNRGVPMGRNIWKKLWVF